jgi:MOSC domain-containing protein YiiM
MELISVNIGRVQPIQNAKPSGKTGIYKQPVSEPVQITPNGLTKDVICDTDWHGGVDQAIYIYGEPDYAWWSAHLRRELGPGTFGENLTISDFESAGYLIGDRFHIGPVILEVTAPRVPCETLAARMGDPSFVKRFRAAERPGLYCRVIQAGSVQVGDEVTYERYEADTVSAIEMFRNFFEPDMSEAALRRYLAAPIAIRPRIYYDEKLKEVLQAQASR